MIGAAALLAVMAGIGTAEAADKRHATGVSHAQHSMAAKHNSAGRNVRRSANNRGHRSGNRHHNSGFAGHVLRGISIYAGDGNGCSYSYRKWQATGSRYWRSRYYDCLEG